MENNQSKQLLQVETDECLIKEYVQQQSEQAFEVLMTRYRGFVFRICSQRLAAMPECLDDAVQAVFLVFAKKAITLQNADRLSGWLARTCVYVTNNMIRMERGRRRREAYAAWESMLDRESEGPPMDCHEQDRVAKLYEALAAIRRHDRQILLDHYMHQVSNDEMARKMACSEEVVRKRLSRARTNLHKALQRQGLAYGMPALITALQMEASTTAGMTFSCAIPSSPPSELVQNLSQVVMRQMTLQEYSRLLAWILAGLAATTSTLWLLVSLTGWSMFDAYAIIEAHPDGTVMLRASDAADWRVLRTNEPACRGMQVRTSAAGQALVRWAGGDTLWIRENSDVVVEKGRAMSLRRGALYSAMAATLSLRTPDMAVRLEPHSEAFLMLADAEPSFTHLDIWQGLATLTTVSGNERREIPAGRMVAMGTACGFHNKPSDRREFGSAFGGVLYREFADLYRQRSFMCTNLTYKPSYLLAHPSAQQLLAATRHDAHAALTKRADHNDGFLVGITAPDDRFHYALFQIGDPTQDAMQWDAIFYFMQRGTDPYTAIGDMAEADACDMTARLQTAYSISGIMPEAWAPIGGPVPHHRSLGIPFRRWLSYRCRYLACGRKPDGERIYEKEVWIDGKLVTRRWRIGQHFHIGVFFRDCSLYITDFQQWALKQTDAANSTKARMMINPNTTKGN